MLTKTARQGFSYFLVRRELLQVLDITEAHYNGLLLDWGLWFVGHYAAYGMAFNEAEIKAFWRIWTYHYVRHDKEVLEAYGASGLTMAAYMREKEEYVRTRLLFYQIKNGMV